MGRHTALDGEAVHPVVAAALAQRPAETAGAHRGERAEGNVGWPGEPRPGGGGLGWPGDLPPAAPSRPRSDAVPADEQPEGLNSGRRRGWRRLFGSDRAA